MIKVVLIWMLISQSTSTNNTTVLVDDIATKESCEHVQRSMPKVLGLSRCIQYKKVFIVPLS